ncbi:MAG: GFA family protein [Bordetella sp.]|nr:GFA family protein [Bordetella sp.]
MSEAFKLTGGCNCGAVRYVLSAPPLAVAACHCANCRKQSGAAYSVNLVVRASTLTVEGDLAAFSDTDTESGAPVERQFCRACGSPIRSLPAATPKIAAVKAGTLDDAGAYAPQVHIWTRSKLPWVELPAGAVQFEQGPPA